MTDNYPRHLWPLAILEQLSSTTYPQSLAQLAHRTALPKTTLMRILRSLEDAAYVTRMPAGMGFVPGPKIHRLSLAVIQTPHFLRACRHILGNLVSIIGESCNLTAPSDDHVRYLARVESPEQRRLQLHMEIGANVPLHCTASGKLFLAFKSDHHRQDILDRINLEALTPSTLTDRDALEQNLRRTRIDQLGIDNEEFVRGMVAIAVPVQDKNGGVIAAVACHAASAQKSLNELLEFIPPMRQAARDMAALFSAVPTGDSDDTASLYQEEP